MDHQGNCVGSPTSGSTDDAAYEEKTLARESERLDKARSADDQERGRRRLLIVGVEPDVAHPIRATVLLAESIEEGNWQSGISSQLRCPGTSKLRIVITFPSLAWSRQRRGTSHASL